MAYWRTVAPRALALFVALCCALCARADGPMRYVYDAPESSLDHRYEYHWEILKTALERTKETYGPYVM